MKDYRRYKRSKLLVVVYGPQKEIHEQIIDVNLFKNKDNEVFVNFEGEKHEVEYVEEKKYWRFSTLEPEPVIEKPKAKPIPKTRKQRTLELVGDVDTYLDRGKDSKVAVTGFIKRTLDLIKESL